MKCNQCDRPALYDYGNNVSLCLACHKIIEDLRFKEILLNEAAANRALDDMALISGFTPGGARYPVEAIAAALRAPMKNTNIVISGSSVGVVNTGDVDKINAVIAIMEGTDSEELGQAIKQLTQAILDSDEIEGTAKKELAELVSSLSEQIATTRSKPVMRAILKGIGERVASVNQIWTLYERVAAALQSAF